MGLKVGVRSCKELRKAKVIEWRGKGLSAADLATLGKLTPVLPALETLRLSTRPDSGPDGGQRLVEGLGVGMLPAVTWFELWDVCAWATQAHRRSRPPWTEALPRLELLALRKAAIGDAGLVALAPALRRRPALKELGEVSTATHSATRASPASWRRHRQMRRRCAAAAG
jgi:hypothetical protein